MDDSKTLELQIQIATQNALMALSSLKGEIKTLASEAKKFAETDGAALKKSFKDAEAAAKDSVSSIGEIKKAIGSLTEVVAATKALSFIKDLGVFALKTADSFQTAKNQFGTLLGDMEAGAGLFNEIKAFNDVTPFDLDTLTQATNVLISAKVPLEDLQNQLTKFGDLSQGNSQRMTSYVNAFSQAAAKGKADMQVLNTYLHQGVPILDALANNFGKTTAEIVQMSSEGKISFADFSKALEDLTAEGGQYFGGMELASKSLAAMQEGLREATNSLASSFGDMLLPIAIAVIGVLTEITNAINNSPIAKGVLAAALVMVAGYLSAMAVKAAVAFAAQMSLNFAIGALNPVVLASTVAVAALAAGYTIYSSKQQEAAREAENMALQQRKQRDAIDETADAIARYIQELNNMTDEQIRNEIHKVNAMRDEIQPGQFRIMQPGQVEQEAAQLDALNKTLSERRTGFIDNMFAGSNADKIQKINNQLALARKYLTDPNLNSGEQSKLNEIIQTLTSDLEKLTRASGDGISEMDRMAAAWKKSWEEVWGQHQADQANDPFYEIGLEQRKKLEDAYNNYVRDENQETIDQVYEYYKNKREKIIKDLKDEESRIQRELTSSKIDDLEYEKEEALRVLKELEQKRIFSAEYTDEEIAKIHKDFAKMEKDIELKFKIKIDKTKLDEARDAVKSWQEELSDTLLVLTMKLGVFGDEASVILSDLTAQLIELSASAMLSGFEEFGRSLGAAEEGADHLLDALAAVAEQILKQLPMMFLQAGLQLIANGQWQLGLGFVAAAGSSAFISGYVDGEKSKASKHAQGGVFDEYGQAARAFAAGGAFTNQIVSSPTYFAHGSGFGLMGEAGPEAIMPLTRMPNGNLGVQTAGGSANVIVNIINNSGAEVRQEETETADGGKQIDITIGEMINRHITSGKADRAMGRYGLRAAGV
jgi:tape measure domain-containing protein